MGNIALLVFSFLFACGITVYLIKVWPDLDLIDLFIIFALFHFGLYPFIRGLYFGKDVIFDFRHSNPIALGLVFAQVLAILAIIRGLSRCFPPKISQNLRLKPLVQQWGSINNYLLIALYVWLIVFQLISYYQYGVRTYISPADFERIGKQLPYWFTSMRTIYNIVAFCVFLGLLANIVKSAKYQRYGWIFFTLLFVPVATIYGRRFFINMIIVGLVLWFAYRQENIFKLKYIKIGLALVVAFFLFSNIYEAHRYVFQTVGEVKPESLKNPLSAALNIDATIKNLKARPGTWEFNFLVIDHQLNQPGMTTNGNVTWQGFKSAIPRFFWPAKQFDLIDDTLSKLYRVTPKDIDIGKNIFGLVQVDVGYFSIAVVPVIILFIFLLLAILNETMKDYPTFAWIVSGNIIFYLVCVEENGNEIFFMFRNVMIILMLWAAYVMLNRLYRHARRSNVAP